MNKWNISDLLLTLKSSPLIKEEEKVTPELYLGSGIANMFNRVLVEDDV